MSRRDFAIGFVSALLIVIATDAWFSKPPSQQELQDEFDSYQICMQSAHVCRMVHEDYVRYHELKRMLDSPAPQ